MYKKVVISLFFVFLINIGEVFSQDRENDSLALIDLYNSTDGDNWTNNTNWKSGTIDTWYGVTVSGDRVTGLDIPNNNLAGSIPSSIGNLTNLTNLNLCVNDLTGTIPSSIENLTSLESLDLAGNDLTGSIPSEVGSLTSLTYLDLENNQLSGSIPSSIGNLSNLRTLDLNENNLDGSIPSEIGDLESLNVLFLNQNELSGSIPSSIESLTGLQHLYLFDNELTGSISSEIGSLTSLMWARLENNQFTGSIPTEIGDLTNLKWLYLSNNELTGSIPSEIGNLEDLEDLQLNGNELTGSIPAEIGDLTSLIKLYLFNNQLEGSIPSEIADMTSLQSLILNNNRLTGSVPEEIADLSSLTHMHIYNNDLVDLPELSSLSELWIQNNKFTFEDIEPNIGISHFNYSPQDSVGSVQNRTVTVGSNLTISVSVGGESNEYQWKKNGSVISGAVSSSYTITSAEMSDSGSYTCEITNTVATDLTLYSRPIKVTVNPAFPHITVTSPNGGEDWKVDSTYDITWTSYSTSGNVDIEYSIDNGSVWREIIASMPDTGIYSWTIPDSATDSCLVRISDTDGDPTDISDSVFSISTSSAIPEEKLPEIYAMSVKTLAVSNKFQVRYSIPEKTSITLGVYNISGTKIEEFREEKVPGIYTKEIDLSGIPSGTYFLKMETEGEKFAETGKIVLVK